MRNLFLAGLLIALGLLIQWVGDDSPPAQAPVHSTTVAPPPPDTIQAPAPIWRG